MAYSQCGHFDGERLARMRDAADAMKRGEDQAQEAYAKVVNQAWKPFERRPWLLLKLCLKLGMHPFDSFDKAEAQAREAYEKAVAPVWEARKKDMTQELEAYKKVKPQVMKEA